MEFIGRLEEQKKINSILDNDGYQGCIIYGRRRMGKTELIKHCLMNKKTPFIMYQCKESTEEDNINQLSTVISKELNMPYLGFKNFIDAIDFLFQYGCENEISFVLDEYPYIRESIAGCDSKLQSVIDKYAMRTNIKFFLLGSSISTMSSLQNHDNPLYMRLTNSILLKQMDYYDSAKFYPNATLEDKVGFYSAFGGVPFYNAQINDKLSLKDNIIRVLSGQFSSLNDFLNIYLKSELRKINNANAVFESIATGAFHFSDILAKTHIDSSASLSVILGKLIEMDLIEYISPINDQTNKKKAGYRISDSCVRFYYNFIYRNESAHRMLSDEIFYEKFIKEELNKKIIPSTFENVSKEFLIRKNKLGQITPLLLDLGTYWYDDPKNKTNGQFDVVGKCEGGYVFFECKYTEKKINDDVIKEEIKQVSKTNLNAVQYGFISKKGFALKEKYPYIFFQLKDLYAEGL